MSESEYSDELIPLKRHVNPKRRLNHKTFHRYRDFYKGDGTMSKMVIIEAKDPIESFEKEAEKLCYMVEELMKSDNSGMNNFLIRYSLGKKKRWDFAKKSGDDLPELLSPVASVSLLKFVEESTMSDAGLFDYSPVIACFHGENPCHRYYGATLKEFSKKTEEATICRKGKFNRKHRVLEPSLKPVEIKIHIQYHVIEYKHNKKVHNSEKFWFWRDRTDQYRKPMTEGCRLNCDVAKLYNGDYVTSMWELNGTLFDRDEHDEALDKDIDSNVDLPKAKGITFADFLIPKMKRQTRRKTISDKWVLV